MDVFGIRRQKGWQAFAKQQGGEYLPEHLMVRYKHRKWNVVIELYEEDRAGEFYGLTDGSAAVRGPKVYTQFRSYIVNQKGLYFKARPRQLVDSVWGWFGARSLKFKESGFRKYVHITANDQVVGREVFVEPDLQKMLVRYRRYLLALEPLQESREHWAFGESGGKLVFRMRDVIHNQAELEKHHLMFIKMLDRLADLEVIGPERPKPTVIKRKNRRR